MFICNVQFSKFPAIIAPLRALSNPRTQMSRAAEIEKPRLSVGAKKLGIPARFTKKGSLTQAGKGLEPKDGEKEAELRRKLLNGTESALQYYNNLWPFHSLLENSCTILNFAQMTCSGSRRESLQIWRRRKTEEIFSIESFSKLHVRS